MRKLLIGAALGALFAVPAVAADPAAVAPATEPITLTLTQMDGVTAAGDRCKFCSNSNFTWQSANAVAVGGSSKFSKFSGNATAIATNVNNTKQSIN
jgi:hypothetical protein